MMNIKSMIFLLLLVTSFIQAVEKDQLGNDGGYIIGDLFGNFGSNLFQVATASALAWDNNSEAYFPNLALIPTIHHHFFSKCKVLPPSNEIRFEWQENEFSYVPIPYENRMRVNGFFQSYMYFQHQRERLLELFEPCQNDKAYIDKKYGWIIDHPNTVGVQIKCYEENDPIGEYQSQNMKDYLGKAMAFFPHDTLFVISSNNVQFAKVCIPNWVKNVYFFPNERYYIEFHTLSLCKHNIISNSSFGWWSAWLNKNPSKVVIRPSDWCSGYPTEEICPPEWLTID